MGGGVSQSCPTKPLSKPFSSSKAMLLLPSITLPSQYVNLELFCIALFIIPLNLRIFFTSLLPPFYVFQLLAMVMLSAQKRESTQMPTSGEQIFNCNFASIFEQCKWTTITIWVYVYTGQYIVKKIQLLLLIIDMVSNAEPAPAFFFAGSGSYTKVGFQQ